MLLMLAIGAGCGREPYTLPDRNDPAVVADEERLRRAVSTDPHVWTSPGTCQVRLLGKASGTLYGWADCVASGPAAGGFSSPVVFDGENLHLPGDGNRHAEDVKRLFPEGLSAAILERPEQMRP